MKKILHFKNPITGTILVYIYFAFSTFLLCHEKMTKSALFATLYKKKCMNVRIKMTISEQLPVARKKYNFFM